MSLKPATTLEEVRSNCSPKPLSKRVELSAFFQESDAGRDERTSLREHLKEKFENSQNEQRVLVYGHRGCGKSTELNRLKEQLGPNWFIVGFSIQEYLPPVGLKTEDILLAIAAAIFDRAKKEQPPLEVENRFLKNVVEFFSDVTTTESTGRDTNLNVSAGAGAKDGGFWSELLGFHANLKSELSVGSRSHTSLISKVRRRPSELVVALDSLIAAVHGALEKIGRKLLIIVEDLDKIGLTDAHDIFVRNALLAKPAANLIYTIPLFTLYSSEADIIRAQFDEMLPFPMLKVIDLQGAKAPGYDIVGLIVRKRVDPSVLDDSALDLLIRGTGGVLRNVFEALQVVGGFRNLKDGKIRREDIRAALDRMSTEIGVQIGHPLDEKGQRNDPLHEILLKSGALIQYNGQQWLGVHPLARKYLTDLGLEVGPDPYGL
jgi:energy-coupling factor transporter ATP-binding protein EcfA2